MKKAIFFLSTLFLFNALFAQHYELAPAESELRWTGFAAIGSYSLSGRIEAKGGTIRFTGDRLTQGELVIDMQTLVSDDYEQLTRHLKSADFFHVDSYPEAIFTLSEASTADVSGILGRLRIKGTEREQAIPLEIHRKNEVLELRGKVKIDRTAFHVNYNSPSIFKNLKENAIADTFELAFQLSFIEK